MQSDYYRHGFDAMIISIIRSRRLKQSIVWRRWIRLAANGGEIAGFQRVELPLVADTRLFREGGDKAAELLLLAQARYKFFMVMNPRVRSVLPV